MAKPVACAGCMRWECWIFRSASIRHIDPKTSVKLRSEASCPESKVAMTTMVIDQSEHSSPVKSPLKMWCLSD